MWQEELAGRVDEQGVELGSQLAARPRSERSLSSTGTRVRSKRRLSICTRLFGTSQVSRTVRSTSVASPRPSCAGRLTAQRSRARAWVTGSAIGPTPRTSRTRSAAGAVRDALNVLRRVSLASRSASRVRAVLLIASALPGTAGPRAAERARLTRPDGRVPRATTEPAPSHRAAAKAGSVTPCGVVCDASVAAPPASIRARRLVPIASQVAIGVRFPGGRRDRSRASFRVRNDDPPMSAAHPRRCVRAAPAHRLPVVPYRRQLTRHPQSVPLGSRLSAWQPARPRLRPRCPASQCS